MLVKNFFFFFLFWFVAVTTSCQFGISSVIDLRTCDLKHLYHGQNFKYQVDQEESNYKNKEVKQEEEKEKEEMYSDE